MSCLLILNPLKHNVYCECQLLSYAKVLLQLPVNCICGFVYDSQNKHKLLSNISSIYRNFLNYHENAQTISLRFGRELLPFLGGTTNSKTQLTKNVTHVHMKRIHARKKKDLYI